jgi:hypothetical protein
VAAAARVLGVAGLPGVLGAIVRAVGVAARGALLRNGASAAGVAALQLLAHGIHLPDGRRKRRSEFSVDGVRHASPLEIAHGAISGARARQKSHVDHPCRVRYPACLFDLERVTNMRDAEGARLREPLTIILGWSALLRSGRLRGDDVRLALDAIVRNARVQAELIDELVTEGGADRRHIS